MATAFVTVGTTRFDDLIEVVTSDEVKKVESVILQIGNSNSAPVEAAKQKHNCNDFEINYYRFKASIYDDI
eukprot:Awhi_evm1s311